MQGDASNDLRGTSSDSRSALLDTAVGQDQGSMPGAGSKTCSYLGSVEAQQRRHQERQTSLINGCGGATHQDMLQPAGAEQQAVDGDSINRSSADGESMGEHIVAKAHSNSSEKHFKTVNAAQCSSFTCDARSAPSTQDTSEPCGGEMSPSDRSKGVIDPAYDDLRPAAQMENMQNVGV